MLDTHTTSTDLIVGRHALRPWHAQPAEPAPDVELLRAAFAPAHPSSAALQHLANAARLVRCEPGPFLFSSPRRPEPSWWLVRQGTMSLGTRGADGHFVEKRSIGPGEWLETAGAMTSPGTWLEQAECRTMVELLAVPLAAMNEACSFDPAFPQAYAAVLARRVRELNDSLHDIVSADVSARLARWLLRRLPPGDPGVAVHFVLPERKQAIAQQLGMTSESLSRALRRLSDAGVVVVNGYELAVQDLPALQRLAFPAPAQKETGR
ncbi:Crp/Fnr family transcriptional regulator [Ideonella sp.]|uniref:Crp/Fnr family transcriptional regulator n=1 Tax=Ideonella sp. TaxID=1929293 RepID=UPI002B48EC0A|nr:Crp/Fnr family transcriptional regulator [Ideonella sp.]HJV67857.1 Crp/Fnr family transcriptional regulator [Ideonella sp.]